ncbi:MAG: hypothetical protein PHF86_12195 [Candidatus Nanoarchaeia archaeon]|nr:hypothetical protein [Candidatus Nanoarchaeia archaeon]
MKKEWLKRVELGEKTIESRWYKHKRSPFNNIKKDELIYFKETGKPVTLKAKVENALFFEGLNEIKIKEIIKNYGNKICINEDYIKELKDKNYCTLVFLKDIEKIKPFNINKKGYGLMNAWISVDNINQLTVF